MKRIVYLMFLGFVVFAGCREKDLDMTLKQKTLYEGATMNEIVAEDAWCLKVIQDSDTSYVELEYSAFLEEYLKVELEGTTLHIGFKNHLYLPGNTVMNATIHTSAINKLNLSDAVFAAVEGSFPETSLTLELEDASTCRGGHFYGNANLKLSDASKCVELLFDGTNCTVDLDDASTLQACLNVSGELTMTLNDASRATDYWGEINHADVKVLDASNLNMATSTINTMSIAVKSASEATVNVVESLEGSVHDASKLYYSGTPTLNVDCDGTSTLQQVEFPNP